MNLRRLQDHIAVPSGLFITILMILWQWANSPYSPSLLNRLDYILYDWRLNSTEYQRKHPDHNIVILDIDERSLKEQGRWPWSRAKVALLLDHLAAEGAIVVGFDVLFSEPEANPVDLISPLIDPDRRAELLSVKDKIDPDLSLARAFDQVDVVLSSLMVDESEIANAFTSECAGRGGSDRNRNQSGQSLSQRIFHAVFPLHILNLWA